MACRDIKPIVLISGPPGAGKSAAALELVDRSEGPVALIEGDLFWPFAVKGAKGEPPRLGFRTIMASMIAAAVPFALSGHETIVDFSIPPWFLPTALRIARAREVPLDYVVLLPSESLCAARAAIRTVGRIEDYASYHDFYATFEGSEHATIEDGDADAATLAARIRAGLDAKAFRVLPDGNPSLDDGPAKGPSAPVNRATL